MILELIAFEVGMKPKKCAPAHVWDHKICFTHYVMIPFALLDRHGHNKAYKHTWLVPVTTRKFFHATQLQAPCCLKLSFFAFHIGF